ncbi:hypothetical protein HanRHA438_Chr15g0712531 [Helianthus annuus]|nr:hypothetical protein HanRHA438_Chr15g0712531 [Helianthus annuus]
MPDNKTTVSQIPDELTMQIAALLRNGLGTQQTTTNSENLSLGIKLGGDNYALWATLMKKAIGGRGRSSHITGDPKPPSKTDTDYSRWEQDDQCVFTWIIQNLESNLVNNVSQYPTAKALWDGLETTYGFGTDSLQVFDLHKRANSLRQGSDTLEDLWNKLQSIWMSIDRRDPNPMKDLEDIQIYNKKTQEQRLYQLLTALDDKMEPVKRDILKKDPLPKVEMAYATIRREAARMNILRSGPSDNESTEIGMGLAAKDWSQRTKFRPRDKEDKSKLFCTHCQMKRHTKDQCFRLVGYPEWWGDGQKQKNSRADGKGTPAAGGGVAPVEKGSSGGFGGLAATTDDISIGHSYEGDRWAWY